MYHTKFSLLSLTIVGLNIFGVFASPSETVDPDTKVNFLKIVLFPAFLLVICTDLKCNHLPFKKLYFKADTKGKKSTLCMFIHGSLTWDMATQ